MLRTSPTRRTGWSVYCVVLGDFGHVVGHSSHHASAAHIKRPMIAHGRIQQPDGFLSCCISHPFLMIKLIIFWLGVFPSAMMAGVSADRVARRLVAASDARAAAPVADRAVKHGGHVVGHSSPHPCAPKSNSAGSANTQAQAIISLMMVMSFPFLVLTWTLRKPTWACLRCSCFAR